MRLKFTKMHGLGNDFVVIDGVRQSVDLTTEQLRAMADRHFGIGCDQILLVEAPKAHGADFAYRIFNADGGEVGQCGNGARCLARFVREHGLSSADEIVVDTCTGRLRLLHGDDGLVTVNMGVPRHAPAEVPLRAEREADHYEVELDGNLIRFGAVSMGNPHAVLLVDTVDTAPVESWGARLESHPIFPERANIGFMAPVDRHHLRLRVYERGAAETLACGSGACGAAVVAIQQDLADSPVRVDLPGGSLTIHWSGRGQPVLMTGPAVTVFHGEIEI